MKNIYYRTSGNNPTALLFVHGWLGNADWWNGQCHDFSNEYQIVQMDLPSHGRSEKIKIESSTTYAEAISAIAGNIDAEKIILVGHSMAGAYVLEASLKIKNCTGIVIVDTLNNLDQLMNSQTAEEVMFKEYRKDFRYSVENFLPKYLFTKETPLSVQERLKKEFLSFSAEAAIEALSPLYAMDVRKYAQEVSVPVVAINSDTFPTNVESNRKYLKKYDVLLIQGTGHYPMLEKPTEFNQNLKTALKQLL